MNDIRVWLISRTYRIKARALHAIGRHCYRLRWTGPSPRHSNRCTWCGQP